MRTAVLMLALSLVLMALPWVLRATDGHACGSVVPAAIDRLGNDTSTLGRRCPGRWVPLRAAPAYRCECGAR